MLQIAVLLTSTTVCLCGISGNVTTGHSVRPSSLPSDCGNGELQTRIIGGELLAPGDYPWMVAILKKSGFGSWYQDCAGVLVSKRHVLTSAGCVVDGRYTPKLPVKDVIVRLAEINLTRTDDVAPVTTIQAVVDKITVHPNYTTFSVDTDFRNDIAIIQLTEEVEFNDFIRPICLPYDTKFPREFDKGVTYIAGWGKYNYRSDYGGLLKYDPVKVVPRENCEEAYSKKLLIAPEHLCIGDTSYSKNKCPVDNGGPLIYNEGGKFYLIGILSRWDGCGNGTTPGVFTGIGNHLDWLSGNF